MSRVLAQGPWRDLTVEACGSCGALWLHEDRELNMGPDFEEVIFHRYARISVDEAEALPGGATDADLAVLGDRPVLASGVGGLSWRKGWSRS